MNDQPERERPPRRYAPTETPVARVLVTAAVRQVREARRRERVALVERNRVLRTQHRAGVAPIDLAALLAEAGDPLSVVHVSRICNAPEGDPSNTLHDDEGK